VDGGEMDILSLAVNWWLTPTALVNWNYRYIVNDKDGLEGRTSERSGSAPSLEAELISRARLPPLQHLKTTPPVHRCLPFVLHSVSFAARSAREQPGIIG
jgi:hypothetical protein